METLVRENYFPASYLNGDGGIVLSGEIDFFNKFIDVIYKKEITIDVVEAEKALCDFQAEMLYLPCEFFYGNMKKIIPTDSIIINGREVKEFYMVKKEVLDKYYEGDVDITDTSSDEELTDI